MTGGTHVTEADCHELRRRRRQGAWVRFLADEFDLNSNTVIRHTTGKCAHSDDPEAPIPPE